MENRKILISRDSITYGPYDRETLFNYIGSGNVSWSDLACYDGDKTYRGLRSFFAFHLTRDGKQFGPFRPISFWKQFLKGKVAPSDSVWVEGLSSWKEAKQVFGEYFDIPKSNLKSLWQDFQPAFKDLQRVWDQVRLESEFSSIEAKVRSSSSTEADGNEEDWSEKSSQTSTPERSNSELADEANDFEELPSPSSQDTSLALLENDEAVMSGALDDELSDSATDDDLSDSESDDDLSEDDDDDEED